MAATLTLAAACGGSGEGGGGQTSNEPLGDSSELLVTNPSQALSQSVDRFEDNVESVSAEFFFEIEIGGFTVGADGTFAYRAPDSVFMVMDMNGGGEGMDLGELGEFEMLVLGEDFYMNTGFTGWVKMSLDDFGADSDSLKKLMEGHAPLDYEQLVKDVGGKVETMGEFTIDGRTYNGVRITTNFAGLMNAIANSVGDSGIDASALPVDLSGPITIDIMIDPETLFPYTFDANGQIGAGEESMNFAMNFKFFGYNGPVDIPPPPPDAKSFDEGFSDVFGDLSAGE
jgi:hypothetical protein